MPVQKITKEEIITIAAGVFRQKGYHNTSMSDLAEACGLTKGLFYHYFSSKEELMKAVLQGVHFHFKKSLFAPAFGNALSPQEKLEKFLGKAKRLFATVDGGCLMANTALETLGTNVEFTPFIRAFFEDWISAMAHIYEHTYQPEVARKVAEEIVQEFEGAVLFMRIYGETRFIDEMLKRAQLRFVQPH
ncbi:MAG: TetR/AcrR family transcriptional regulator [Candidatus Kapaibacterium sp.]|nr:MAG: TetR/AcrR family transcriptional regulator [Candidatus Kapabacteria bacterium]